MLERRLLPQRRQCETFEIAHGLRDKYFVTVGYHHDRSVGEVFITYPKSGESEALARDGAILLSLCLQHGVPVETLQSAITRNHDNSPSTIIGAVVDRLVET